MADLTRQISASLIPETPLLPHPLADTEIPVGQLVSKTAKCNPSTLEYKDYDDVGHRWYKDVIIVESSGTFVTSLGATLYVNKDKQLKEGQGVGTIEAPEMRVRIFKDPEAALAKALSDPKAKEFIEGQGEVGFVTAIREVTNASYKRAKLVDRGMNNWEVIREVGGEGHDGKRRDSQLQVLTGSKTDIVGVVVRKVVIDGDRVALGEELGTEFWA
ncbi:hypothetical protein P154DRAFT_349666 [Amniculicola lignicola CBS 123094]|uniref:Uncharacterized protein n=1 Tax=Amniculicola lignicola CBS 123094 TaxID=1392246 RepID=A0A6A5W7Z8_9PLEO|nr:hypothetical protein P154DRAFT_349666 [Amniculicola lignicola CBS 123094]